MKVWNERLWKVTVNGAIYEGITRVSSRTNDLFVIKITYNRLSKTLMYEIFPILKLGRLYYADIKLHEHEFSESFISFNTCIIYMDRFIYDLGSNDYELYIDYDKIIYNDFIDTGEVGTREMGKDGKEKITKYQFDTHQRRNRKTNTIEVLSSENMVIDAHLILL